MAPEEYDFNINPDAPLFVISVVSEMVDIPVWTLRKLDDLGVICPKRLGKKTRCYSKLQIKELHKVRYFLIEKKVNISGIKVILEMNTEGSKSEERKEVEDEVDSRFL